MSNIQSLLSELQSIGNAKTATKFQARYGNDMTVFGVGLTALRKLAKNEGKNADLAKALWQENIYEAKALALLIDDPKTMTREQAERQVEQLNFGQLPHIFSSCDATLAKTKFSKELLNDWILQGNDMHRRCGYGLLYEESKNKKKSAPDDAFFEGYIRHISKTFNREPISNRHAVGIALMGIGSRNITLHEQACKVAKALGDFDIETEHTRCEPFNVLTQLTHPVILKRLGLED